MGGGSFYELDRFLKEDVGAITLVGFEFSVVNIGVVEVIISPVIWDGPNMRGRKPDGFVKATIFRPERIIGAQMPFPKESRGIAGFTEEVCHCRNLGPE